MSASLFGVFRLGRDAKLVDGPSGKFVSMSIAYDRYDSAKSERVPEWVSVTFNGQRAEKMAEHLLKGTLVEAIITDPRLSTYKNKEGHDVPQLQGVVSRLDFVGGKGNGTKPEGEQATAGAEDDNPPF